MRRQPITNGQRAKVWLAMSLYCVAVWAVFAWVVQSFFGATR
ncbi:hypothetical protein [Caulobacter hibisci]|nr:hypothetical protein [Caulobacter hibisci]